MTPVDPKDLPKHWEFVRAGLEQVIRRCGERWTPTHVEQAIRKCAAFLFVHDDGFVVLQRLEEDWTSEPYIHVWAMWFKPGKAKEKRGALTDWLDTTAAQAGCRYWKFTSTRMGWKALDGYECVIDRVTFRRKING